MSTPEAKRVAHDIRSPAQERSGRSRRTVIILLSVLIAAAVLFGVFVYAPYKLYQVVTFSSNVGYSKDTRPIELKLVDQSGNAVLDLRVPKAYLTWTPNWGGGKQEFLKIQAFLPDMQPR